MCEQRYGFMPRESTTDAIFALKMEKYREDRRHCVFVGTVALRKRQEAGLDVAEMKVLTYSLGVTRMARIRNEYISEMANVRCVGGKAREARDCLDRGRPERIFMDRGHDGSGCERRRCRR
ncbi:hypothetical protein GOODEAATRI_031933 [Goodea atripinnis]|uniref:Uncharacterized protein n=1 Tax=Goodea atripinnis TaxID=208336 RepID=A0ABV0MYB2_9TELE